MSNHSHMNPFASARPVAAPVTLFDTWLGPLQPYMNFFKLSMTEPKYIFQREMYEVTVLDHSGERFGNFHLSDRTPFTVDYFFGPDTELFDSARYYEHGPLVKDLEKLKNIVETTPGVRVEYLMSAFYAYNSGYNFDISETPHLKKYYTLIECMRLLSFLEGDLDTAHSLMSHRVSTTELSSFTGLPHAELKALFNKER